MDSFFAVLLLFSAFAIGAVCIAFVFGRLLLGGKDKSAPVAKRVIARAIPLNQKVSRPISRAKVIRGPRAESQSLGNDDSSNARTSSPANVSLKDIADKLIGAINSVNQMQSAYLNDVEALRQQVSAIVQLHFLVSPCFHCQEFKMKILAVSPNGRSVQYECNHCKRKMSAAAGTPEASSVVAPWNELRAMINKHNIFTLGKLPLLGEVYFDTPAAPLPYEQTSRTPISEAVRAEVWRRDGGKCVQCGSKQNLQFDHIIPVSRGGATTVINLQLLCQPCNGSKGAKI